MPVTPACAGGVPRTQRSQRLWSREGFLACSPCWNCTGRVIQSLRQAATAAHPRCFSQRSGGDAGELWHLPSHGMLSAAKSAARRGRIPWAGALNGASITSTDCGHSGQLSWPRGYLMGQHGDRALAGTSCEGAARHRQEVPEL